MSSTTEPDSTPITGENIAASQQGVRRLQGGALRFLDAHEIPATGLRRGHPTVPEQQHPALEAGECRR